METRSLRKFVRLFFRRRDFRHAGLLGMWNGAFTSNPLSFHVFNAHLYACKRCT